MNNFINVTLDSASFAGGGAYLGGGGIKVAKKSTDVVIQNVSETFCKAKVHHVQFF